MPDETLFERASERHVAGDLPGARQLYAQLLADDAAHGAAMLRLGVIALQEGAAAGAIEWLRRALAIEPGQRRYREALGQAYTMAGRHEEAAAIYRGLLADDPSSADLWCGFASAWQAHGALAQAADAWRAALLRDAHRGDAWNNLGNCLRLLGEPRESEAAYRRALAVQPGDANALTNLGTLMQEEGREDEALACLRDALAAAPGTAVAMINLGVLLTRLGPLDEALSLLERAIVLEPHLAPAAYNYGVALQAQGRLRDAGAQYRRALALDPAHAEAACNLGNVCRDLGEHRAAQEAYETAIHVRPDFVDAYNNAANLMRTLGGLDEAQALLRKALELDPSRSATLNNLGNVLKDGGDLDEGIECFRRAVTSEPGNLIAHSNLLYALSFQVADPHVILDEARRWSAQHEAPLRQERTRAHGEWAEGRRLRIGYVSADFREHCQALFMTPLLAHHDRTRFEIHAYSSVVRPDATTARLAAHVEKWRDVRTLSDAALADRIRADGIDILADLTMHMSDGRPLVFARKPAPVQVAWLAYPGTTGIGAMDWRLTDPWLDPGVHDSHYSEQSWRLPHTFWCYDPLDPDVEVNPLPPLTAGSVTFGSLNNPCKLTDASLAMWAGVFERLPAARLVQRLVRAGIDPARVRFVPFRPREAYLRNYHEIDLALDTLPYNGHATSLDALWMGVPVVTRVGPTVAGPAGLSQLANLGLTDLAAGSDETLMAMAGSLANDLPRLARPRATLRERVAGSPLMDGERFARGMEHAYEGMWRAAAR
ncbi:putative O-linked N-acetylglucosamine transferase (SPINDLY family) [Paraburkholderia unamae]|uniref:tetratricopeptide repeat protein n=1 Tax=Paraburkholderia unamae TaxID=219649 RepID=UPI000DC5BE7F|nr:tetratricopeptide repeat protein [Paraburkholderia unamae]RAR51904.1 putative O-linked N-acetylglucosamine transferase (SPINDLY family) [Paraburkholderia unamae]